MHSVPALGNGEASGLLVDMQLCALRVGRVEGDESCRGEEGVGAPHASAPLPPHLAVSSQQPGDGDVVTGAELQR